MKQIDIARLQADMDEHGYTKTRLAGVLRCSLSTVTNIFSRGSINDEDVSVLEMVFERPVGYYLTNGSPQNVPQQNLNLDELLKAVNVFSTNTFAYQMSLDKSLKQLNDTALQIMTALNNLRKSVDKLEGISNNNTGKLTTSIAKVRTDTEAIKSSVADIVRSLK